MFLVLLPAACRWPCCLTSSSLCMCRHTWQGWSNPGFSSSVCKRGRAVFPEEGNNGKRAIIQWFDLALTAGDPDSQCSEVKNEKISFTGHRIIAKKRTILPALNRWEGVHALAAIPLLAHPAGSPIWNPVRKWKHWVCLSGKETQLQQSLQVLFTCRNHTLLLPPLTTRSYPGHISTKVLISQVKINRF